MNVEMMVFDLDGTLLNNQGEISFKNLSVINECKEKGVLVALASSRCKITFEREIELIRPEIVISSNGALITYGNKTILQREISAVDVRHLLAYFNGLYGTNIEITIDTVNAFYWDNFDVKQLDDVRWKKIEKIDVQGFSESALKICVKMDIEAQINDIKAKFPMYYYLTYTGENWLQITNFGISKKSAVLYVCKALSIDINNTIAFGDDVADIGMLVYCGCGVAMGNAPEIVKEKANIVLGNNNSDSIADFLSTLIKNDIKFIT